MGRDSNRRRGCRVNDADNREREKEPRERFVHVFQRERWQGDARPLKIFRGGPGGGDLKFNFKNLGFEFGRFSSRAMRDALANWAGRRDARSATKCPEM
jgi:hypothetical protein